MEYTPAVKPTKTLFPGIAKSRKGGGPTISLQKMIDRTKMSSFASKVKEEMGEKADEARATLAETPAQAAKSHARSGAIGGTVAPVLEMAGGALEAGLEAPRGHRLQNMAKSLSGTQVADVARRATGGALFGASTDVAKGQLKREAAKTFIANYEKKSSMQVSQPPKPAGTPPSAKGPGQFKGMATSTFLKPPGPAASTLAVNPRKNIRHAMAPGMGSPPIGL